MKLHVLIITVLLTVPLSIMAGARHAQIQQKFKQLRAHEGMQTEHAHMHRMHPHHGRQGNQTQMDDARGGLNSLLEKPVLSPSDIAVINQKIKDFKALNPARWPQPQHYEELLAKKVERQEREQKEREVKEQQAIQLEQQKKAPKQASVPSQIAKKHKKIPLTLKKAIKQGRIKEAQQLIQKGQQLTEAELDGLAKNGDYAQTLIKLGLIPPPPSASK